MHFFLQSVVSCRSIHSRCLSRLSRGDGRLSAALCCAVPCRRVFTTRWKEEPARVRRECYERYDDGSTWECIRLITLRTTTGRARGTKKEKMTRGFHACVHSCIHAFMHSCIHAFSTTTTTRETDEPGFVRLNNNDRLERVMDEISHCA